MHSSNVRRSQHGRRFEGAEDGFALVGWLLLNSNTPEGQRTVKLIRDLQRLRLAKVDLSISEIDKRPVKFRSGSRNLEQNRLARSIDSQMKALFQRPTFLGFRFEGGRMLALFHRFPNRRFPRARLIADPLENLGRLGLIDRIRQCLSCGLALREI